MLPRLLVAVLILLALGALPPRVRADEPAGVLTKPPAVVHDATPEFPEAAKAEGATGVVALELELSEQGEVVDAVVTQPAGHGFDEAALAAARKLVFSPAEVDGKPSPVRIEYRFNFTLAAAPAPQAPPQVNLRGRVVERGSREPVVGALVTAGGKRAVTGADGRFELAGVPDGKVQVVVEDGAHATFRSEEEILPGQATELTAWVRRTAADAYELTVVGEREKKEVAHVALSSMEVRKVPGVSGDAVKVIQNLPGVARPSAMSGELIVRGGNARDTRVYVDGHEVPQVFHFGGLTSVYSSDLIKDVEFEAGNFGARYGRAIGGRVNLETRDPGEKVHALADMNLYHATALWEGKAAEDLTLAVAARRSYADAMIKAAVKQMDDPPSLSVAPRYYDLQLKGAWKPRPEDAVRFDVYGSDDRMKMTGFDSGTLENIDGIDLGTKFWAASVRWTHRFDEDTRLELDLGGGVAEFDLDLSTVFQDHEKVPNTTGRVELHHTFGKRARMVAGFDGTGYLGTQLTVTAPEIPPPGEVPSPGAPSRRFHKSTSAGEGGVFVEGTFEPVDGLTVVPGLRADVHRTLGTLAWVDPRLAVRWKVGENLALKGAVGLYHQAPPIVYMTREWGNPDLGPEGARQYAVGAEQKLFGKVSLDLQLYWKELYDLALPSSAVVERDGQQVLERYRSAGTGRSYGAELLLRWDPDGRFFGWVAYSLSRTKRDQALANGSSIETQGDAYDQPHNVVAVGTWELPEVWDGLSAGFRLRYTSGNPYEPIVGAIYDADADYWSPIGSGKYSRRQPAFFQADLRVDRKWTFRTWTFTAYLEVQNATNRKNPEGVAYSADYSQKGWITGLPLFPAFGLRAEY
ncbi:MAG: TonB-dependent receptor [Anaeromyxobacteraceae bacterium]